MNQILRILLEITIYSVVLFAAVMLFKRLFRRHMSPVLGYAVWALLILRLMIPVTINSDMRLFVIPETTAAPIQTTYDVAPQLEVMPVNDTDTAASFSDNDMIASDNIIPASQPDRLLSASDKVAVTTHVPGIKPVRWQTVLVIVWAAGMAVSAGVLLLLFSRIQHRTSKGSPAPENIWRLVGACKRDMGIRADIKIQVHDWLATPALTASLKPKLLLPQSMLTGMDLRQIEYGIRHELMHYRHRDHLTALLLMLLRCVYWFNPVVWFASKQIETDMEAACDAAVTASLGRLECYDYAQTMIDLGSKADAYMLGMGVSSGRASMEKRVRGIFMEKRTKLPVRLAALVLSCLLVFTCFTTACQPVKAEPVDNAATVETQEETAQAPAEPIPTPAPAPEVNPNEGYGNFPEWVETYSIPNLNVDINAQIVTPDADVFPVYKVQKRSFDNETLQRMLDYFAGDVVGVRVFSFTKDELKEQLSYFKEHDAEKKDIIKDLKTQISLVQPEAFNAIDENESLYGAYIFQTVDGSRVNYMAGEDWCEISKYTGNYLMQYEKDIRYGSWPHLIKYMDKTLKASKLTEQEAMALAQKALGDMGIDNMGVVDADRAVIVNTCLDAFPSAGWNVSFARTDNGSVPADLSLQDSRYFNFKEDDYFERWQIERLGVYVDDEGVESISWSKPQVVSEVAEGNVTLMTWDKAKQAIRDAMSLGFDNYMALRQDAVMTRDINIAVDKIVLTNVLVPQGDGLDYQLAVPAWVIYNEQVWETENERRIDMMEIFAVNAIDGSVIDLTSRTHVGEQRFEELQEQREEDEAAQSSN